MVVFVWKLLNLGCDLISITYGIRKAKEIELSPYTQLVYGLIVTYLGGILRDCVILRTMPSILSAFEDMVFIIVWAVVLILFENPKELYKGVSQSNGMSNSIHIFVCFVSMITGHIQGILASKPIYLCIICGILTAFTGEIIAQSDMIQKYNYIIRDFVNKKSQ